MRIKYNRDQKIKGNLTRNFDKDYAFLEKALDRSGDIVKNVFYVGDTADIQSIMEEQTDANTDSDINSDIGRKTVSKRIVKTTQNNKKIKPKKAAVIYWSGTGNTEAMAGAVLEGMKAAGADAALLTPDQVTPASLSGVSSVAMGCPAMGSEVLEEMEFQPMFDSIKNQMGGKAVGLFGSFGWGDGEWMRSWEKDCDDAGINRVCDSITCCEAPDDDVLAACQAMGRKLAE